MSTGFKKAVLKIAAENPEFREALKAEIREATSFRRPRASIKSAATRYNVDGEMLTKAQMLKKVKSKEMEWDSRKNKPSFVVLLGPSREGDSFKVSQKDFDKLRVKDHTPDSVLEKWIKHLVKNLSIADSVDFVPWAKGKSPQQKLDWLSKKAGRDLSKSAGAEEKPTAEQIQFALDLSKQHGKDYTKSKLENMSRKEVSDVIDKIKDIPRPPTKKQVSFALTLLKDQGKDKPSKKDLEKMDTEEVSKMIDALKRKNKTAAANDSLQAAIEKGLGEIVSKLGKSLQSKYPKALKGFGKPYNHGAYQEMKVSSEINNARDKSRPGDMIITASFDSRYPKIEVYAAFPGADPYVRSLAFSVGDSARGVAKGLGAAFQRDLDYWMFAVAKAYEEA